MDIINYIYIICMAAVYVCIAYSFVLYTTSLVRRNKPARDFDEDACPRVSVIASIYNERDIIEAKLKNLSEIIYPAGRVEFILVDGSSPDGTGDVIKKWIADNDATNFTLLIQKNNRGKVDALNIGLAAARHDIVIVTDADTELVPGVLKSVVRYFSDPCVGAVGPWILPQTHEGLVPSMEMSFWIANNKMRTLESRISSSSLIAGCYLFRRSIQRHYPPNVVADDFYTALNVSSKGYDVIYVPQVMGSELRTPHDFKTWVSHKMRKGVANLQTIFMFRGSFKAGNKRSFIYYNKLLQHIVVPLAFAGFGLLHLYYALLSLNALSYFGMLYDLSSPYSWYLYLTNLPLVILPILAADVALAAGAVYANRSVKRRIPRGNVESRRSSVVLVAAAAVFSQAILLGALLGFVFTSPTSKYKRIS